MPFCNHIISINTKEIVRKLTTRKAGLHATNKACMDITIAIKEMEPCSYIALQKFYNSTHEFN